MSNLSNKTIDNTYKSVLNIGTEANPNATLTSSLSVVSDGVGNQSSLSISTANNGARVTGPFNVVGGATVTGPLTANNGARVTGPFNVVGGATVTGPLSVQGEVYVGTDKFIQFGATDEGTDTCQIRRVNSNLSSPGQTELRVVVGDDASSVPQPLNDTFRVGGLNVGNNNNIFSPTLTVATSGSVIISPPTQGVTQDVLVVSNAAQYAAPGWPTTWGGGIRTWNIRCESISARDVYASNVATGSLIFPDGSTINGSTVWLNSSISLSSVSNNTYTRTVIPTLPTTTKSVIIQISQNRINSFNGTTTQVYLKSALASSLELTGMLHYSNDGNSNGGYVGQGMYPVSIEGSDVVIYIRHTRNGSFGVPNINVVGYTL
jgi:hypothetical protein